MATSSITKNFVVSGSKQVEVFAEAIETSYQEKSNHSSSVDGLNVKHLYGEDELKKFMQKRKKLNA